MTRVDRALIGVDMPASIAAFGSSSFVAGMACMTADRPSMSHSRARRSKKNTFHCRFWVPRMRGRFESPPRADPLALSMSDDGGEATQPDLCGTAGSSRRRAINNSARVCYLFQASSESATSLVSLSIVRLRTAGVMDRFSIANPSINLSLAVM